MRPGVSGSVVSLLRRSADLARLVGSRNRHQTPAVRHVYSRVGDHSSGAMLGKQLKPGTSGVDSARSEMSFGKDPLNTSE
jgi:hypothetical protein